MAGNLERSRGLEQQFLLSVSHDLRTPLTSIRGYAEAVADGTAPDSGLAAGIILAEAHRLERLVKDLLDLAKLEARQFTLDMVAVDCGGAGATRRRRLRSRSRRRRCRDRGDHTTEPGDGRRAIPIDSGRCLANLIENALKYAPDTDRGRSHPGQRPGVRLEVSDDGLGRGARGPAARLRAVVRRSITARSQGIGVGAGPGHRARTGRRHGRTGHGGRRPRWRHTDGGVVPSAARRGDTPVDATLLTRRSSHQLSRCVRASRPCSSAWSAALLPYESAW